MKCDHIPILFLEGKGNILWSLHNFLEERGSQGLAAVFGVSNEAGPRHALNVVASNGE
ncbi:MAG: hypothetical protein GTN76_15750 [Candidatus Aenigmarchaeota archaeon]|nr:hypothetical protein [Candidatus Aenigmarchaeota archaeon]